MIDLLGEFNNNHCRAQNQKTVEIRRGDIKAKQLYRLRIGNDFAKKSTPFSSNTRTLSFIAYLSVRLRLGVIASLNISPIFKKTRQQYLTAPKKTNAKQLNEGEEDKNSEQIKKLNRGITKQKDDKPERSQPSTI